MSVISKSWHTWLNTINFSKSWKPPALAIYQLTLDSCVLWMGQFTPCQWEVLRANEHVFHLNFGGVFEKARLDIQTESKEHHRSDLSPWLWPLVNHLIIISFPLNGGLTTVPATWGYHGQEAHVQGQSTWLFMKHYSNLSYYLCNWEDLKPVQFKIFFPFKYYLQCINKFPELEKVHSSWKIVFSHIHSEGNACLCAYFVHSSCKCDTHAVMLAWKS